MSYGVRVWGPTGALELDETSFTVGVTFSALISKSAGRFIDISVPGVEPTKYSAVCVPVAPYDTGGQFNSAIGFIPEILNGSVRIWFGNRQSSSGPLGSATQRLLVMRYR
ncbi:hypothetical protein JFT33_05850 [Pseudomonas carnis]|uniref:hypothetical protein n=1 Tax=Pseudomonas TaxID=286 RepID=UPI0009B90C49|nr:MULTISPECIES: hypothetical protein [Pseudomonas]MBJ2206106.1 hypothetical protein [Pseudomonas carnis]